MAVLKNNMENAEDQEGFSRPVRFKAIPDGIIVNGVRNTAHVIDLPRDIDVQLTDLEVEVNAVDLTHAG